MKSGFVSSGEGGITQGGLRSKLRRKVVGVKEDPEKSKMVG